jgi:hypothetical protein
MKASLAVFTLSPLWPIHRRSNGVREEQSDIKVVTVAKNPLRYMKILSHDLVEFLSPESTALSFPALLTILLTVSVLVIGFIQADGSSDDDDSGPGDGGIMQPVSTCA